MLISFLVSDSFDAEVEEADTPACERDKEKEGRGKRFQIQQVHTCD